MAAHEIERQRVVALVRAGVRCQRNLLVGGHQADHQLLPQPLRRVGADLVGESPGRDAQQPAARVVGLAFARPLVGSREERLLHGVLAAGEVAIPPRQDAQHLRRERAQEMLPACQSSTDPQPRAQSVGGPLITCRTSMGMRSGVPF